MIPLLAHDDPFPPVQDARQDLGGLLAIGGDLSHERLLNAYRQGIFPWGTHLGHPLWYCPDPRMVHFPQELRVTRSLRKTLRQLRYEIRLDSAFPAVINACSAVTRRGQQGTWISEDMKVAYTNLHELGWAHSVETWVDGQLAGGLYGLAIGNIFFGESMFSLRPDASKIAFAHLTRYLAMHAFRLVDCQMHTNHLASLGAREISGSDFATFLADLADRTLLPGRWPIDGAASLNWS